ncbi:uncharacterized protein cd34 [Danio aesculapii]|uniref:uncharacterized protein cd34 n=1 Tax=Danio aesculapii TaxID=1142201 RepID=UPI0024C0E6C8|nr:uncharacterized protein cd34 [Danio aesculapii]
MSKNKSLEIIHGHLQPRNAFGADNGTAQQLSQITKTSSLRPGWRSDESQAAVQPTGYRRQSLLFKHKAHEEERASLEICASGDGKMDSTLLDNTLAIIRVIASPFEKTMIPVRFFVVLVEEKHPPSRLGGVTYYPSSRTLFVIAVGASRCCQGQDTESVSSQSVGSATDPTKAADVSGTEPTATSELTSQSNDPDASNQGSVENITISGTAQQENVNSTPVYSTPESKNNNAADSKDDSGVTSSTDLTRSETSIKETVNLRINGDQKLSKDSVSSDSTTEGDNNTTSGGSSSAVFVSVLVTGLLLAAIIVGIYYFKCHRRTNGKGMKLAEESYMADEENQGNTLVSVAPLNQPEPQEKPSLNGESQEAVKPQTPAATNGHSTTKTADTEL